VIHGDAAPRERSQCLFLYFFLRDRAAAPLLALFAQPLTRIAALSHR
jgi:hypothetical protein